jgi:hypothetical protein
MVVRTKISSSTIVALIGFVVCGVAFYPGFMSPDSFWQYEMSRTLVFSDFHPPIMAGVWSVLNVFFNGPQGLLFFHLAMLWTALYLFHRRYADLKYSWLILAIGFLPWVINLSGVLWKDVGMAYSLLLMTALMLGNRSPARILGVFLLIFYAANVRFNAVFAVVPLLVFVTSRWLPEASVVKVAVATIGTMVLIFGGGSILSYDILRATQAHQVNNVIIDDLAYLSLVKNRSLIPEVPFENIQKCASRDLGQTKLTGKYVCLNSIKKDSEPDLLSLKLKPIWAAQVKKAPLAYIWYRLSVFSYFLRSPDFTPYYFWHHGVDQNDVGIKQQRNGATLLVKWMVNTSANVAPFLFKPYWWLWFSSILLLLSYATRKANSKSVEQVLLISSICYIGGYFPATGTADFRYMYWSVIASSLAAILMFINRDYVIEKLELSRKNVALMAVALCGTLIVFNTPVLFPLYIDDVVGATSPLNKRAINVTPSLYHLKEEDGKYFVVGDDPQVIFDVSSAHLTPTNIKYLEFEFSCIGRRFRPRLQIFWWGGEQPGPTEERSITIEVRDGRNAFSAAGYKDWTSLEQIKGIRMDLAKFRSCKAITVKDLTAYY